MIKKLISLCSTTLLILSAPMIPASAQTIENQQGENGIYTYLSEDFQDFNTGMISDATGAGEPLTYDVTDSSGRKITDVLTLYNTKASTATFSLEEITEEDGNRNKVLQFTQQTNGPGPKAGWRLKNVPKAADKKDYLVIQTKIMNGGNDASNTNNKPFNYMYGISSNVRISNASVQLANLSGITGSAPVPANEWYEYMLVFNTATKEMQVVIDGQPTAIKATITDDLYTNLGGRYFSDPASTNYIGEEKKVALFDEYHVYGVAAGENKLTCTGKQGEGNTAVWEFSNPVSLTEDNITVSGGATVSGITYADGKYTVSLANTEAASSYTVTLNNVSDVFGHTLSNESVTVNTVAVPRTHYGSDDFEDGALSADFTQGDGAPVGGTATWSVTDTMKNDGSPTKAYMVDIVRSGDSGKVTLNNCKLVPAKGSFKSNRYFVFKAKLRFGEPDGSNAAESVNFCGTTVRRDGAVTVSSGVSLSGQNETYNDCFRSGDWAEVTAAIYLDPAVSNGATKAYISIDGKYICEYKHNLNAGAVLSGRAGIMTITGASEDVSRLYIDDISMYTIDKEPVAAELLSVADSALRFTTEHALVGFAPESVKSVTVDGIPAAVSAVSENNGVYSVILSDPVAVGSEVSVLLECVTDVAGNTSQLLELSGEAEAPAIVKSSLRAADGMDFLTVNSACQKQESVLFFASYDAEKRLVGVDSQEVVLQPGVQYFKSAAVDGASTVKAILVDSYAGLKPLMAQ